jgi:alkyl hydroperoxide reductase subunit AhpF
MSQEQPLFDEETWQQLPGFFEKLPETVHIHVWGDEKMSQAEKETARLGRALADRFQVIRFRMFPRRVNYAYYPVLGFMGESEGETVDYGVRIIGWPAGYQMTSLITAVQAVSFRGSTVEPATRIRLHQLSTDVNIEVMTSAENEGGSLMAKIVFGLAVASPYVRGYLIMADMFPEASIRYSAKLLPHTVINRHVHIEGVVDEAEVMKHLASAVKSAK